MADLIVQDISPFLVGEKVDFLKLFMHRIRISLHFKFNIITLITGKSGAGKSYLALRLGEALDGKWFDPRVQIVYNAWQFLYVCKYLIKAKHQRTLILDESQATIPARKWYDFFNLAVQNVLTTFRGVKRVHFIVVTPFESIIDSSVRCLADYLFDVKKIIRSDKVVIRPYHIVPVRIEFGKFMFQMRKFSVYEHSKRRTIFFKKVEVGFPSKKNIEIYEDMAYKFKRRILETQFRRMISRVGKEEKEIMEEYREFMEEVTEWKRKDGGKLEAPSR